MCCCALPVVIPSITISCFEIPRHHARQGETILRLQFVVFGLLSFLGFCLRGHDAVSLLEETEGIPTTKNTSNDGHVRRSLSANSTFSLVFRFHLSASYFRVRLFLDSMRHSLMPDVFHQLIDRVLLVGQHSAHQVS